MESPNEGQAGPTYAATAPQAYSNPVFVLAQSPLMMPANFCEICKTCGINYMYCACNWHAPNEICEEPESYINDPSSSAMTYSEFEWDLDAQGGFLDTYPSPAYQIAQQGYLEHHSFFQAQALERDLEPANNQAHGRISGSLPSLRPKSDSETPQLKQDQARRPYKKKSSTHSSSGSDSSKSPCPNSCGTQLSSNHYRQTLHRHEARHCRNSKKRNNYEPPKCDTCGKRFSRKDGLKIHIKRIHERNSSSVDSSWSHESSTGDLGSQTPFAPSIDTASEHYSSVWYLA